MPLVQLFWPAPSHLSHPSGHEDAILGVLSPADTTWRKGKSLLLALSWTSELCSKLNAVSFHYVFL